MDEAVWFDRKALARRDEEDADWRPENVYRLVGARWAVPVLRELGAGTLRYNVLHRRLGGVSHKMLTETLRRLERANLVSRRSHPTIPPAVDYGLTTAGRDLLDGATALARWAAANGLES